MKKFIILAIVLLCTRLGFASEPAPKVLAAFQKIFQPANGVNWYAVKDGAAAFFVQGNVRYRVTFDAEGNILNSIRYYGVQELSFWVKAKIQKQFEGKVVYGITEVTVNDETCYHIILQDASHWISVHADAYGNAFVEARHQRAEASNDLAKK